MIPIGQETGAVAAYHTYIRHIHTSFIRHIKTYITVSNIHDKYKLRHSAAFGVNAAWSRGDCSFVSFIYVTISFVICLKKYVKNRNRRISSLVLGIGSRRSPSGFVRSDRIVLNRPSLCSPSALPGPGSRPTPQNISPPGKGTSVRFPFPQCASLRGAPFGSCAFYARN